MLQPRSWYREPLVWMLIAIPLTAVIVGLTMLVIANRTHDGLVVDDYYKKGKEINMVLARDQAAARRGLRGDGHLNAAAQSVELNLTAAAAESLPEEIRLRWLHATRSGHDRDQLLMRGPRGRYAAAFPDLAPGHWYVQVEALDWRLQGSLHIPQEVRFELKALVATASPAK